MAKLILLRHAKSQWNLENRFSGWVDNPLSKSGIRQIAKMAKGLKNEKIDAVFSSPLIRNEETVSRLLLAIGKKYPIFIHLDSKLFLKRGSFVSLNKNYVPVYLSEALNERYYGSLQGLNKEETIKKYGEKKVHLWRRGFDNPPPGKGESLKMVCLRVEPFFEKKILAEIKKNKNVLVVASHNSLRAIVSRLELLSPEKIVKVEIPFGGMLKYDLDKRLRPKKYTFRA